MDECNPNREGWRRAQLGLLLVALSSVGCPQLRDDDFTQITPAPGPEAPEGPTRDASAPSEPLDAGDDGDAGAGAPSDASDAGDAGDAGAGDADAGQDAGAAAPDAGDDAPACVASTELCDGRDNDCDELIDELTACAAGCVGLTLQGRGAMYCGGPGIDFVTAEARCAAQGMRLVGVDSAEKNAAVVEATAPLYASLATLVEGQASIWFDARDSQTEGTWITGEAGTVFWIGAATGAAQGGAYVNWGSGRPNDSGGGAGEDCGVLYVASGSEGDVGTWNDNTCTGLHTFLCEAPLPSG